MSSASSRPSLRSSVALVWRTLRSMRTALILLLMLALASAAGALWIPQLPNSPDEVALFIRRNPLLGELLLRAGFFDVFGSWWFTLITALLFVSLVSCLIPRSRAHVRVLRSRPLQAREIDVFPHYAERRGPMAPKRATVVASRVLRRRRFRV